tara:strand:- start:106 stop:1032 length:927 start_codon:yes stop_codon:yes gene_type:complete
MMSDIQNIDIDIDIDTTLQIGSFAPSSYIDVPRFDAGIKALAGYGFNVYAHPQCYSKHNQSAGTDAEKIKALYDLFNEHSLDVIIAAGGGNRALHLLDQIDFSKIAGSKALYCGYSDSTVLCFALHTQAGLKSVYGPMVQNVHDLTKADRKFFLQLISKNVTSYDFGTDAVILKDGHAEGTLIGGTLSMLPNITGTKYMPNIDGHILYVEDCNEELSRIDRMFCHLKTALPFAKLGGLIIGDFKNVSDTGRPYGFTIEDIIREHSDVINGPVIMNAPFGHGARMQALPFGVNGQLTARNGKASLDFNI